MKSDHSKIKATLATVLANAFILFGCGDDESKAPVDLNKESAGLVSPPAMPKNAQGVYSFDLAQSFMKDEINAMILEELFRVHKNTLPRTFPYPRQSPTYDLMFSPASVYTDIDGSDELFSVKVVEVEGIKCVNQLDQPFIDEDGDAIPKSLKGSMSCLAHMNLNRASAGYDFNEELKYSLSFLFQDSNDKDWRDGYKKEIDYQEDANFDGENRNPYRELLIHFTKSGWALKQHEKTDVKTENGKYIVHSEKEKLSLTKEGKRAYFSHSLDLIVNPSEVSITRPGLASSGTTYKSLVRKGMLKSITGLFRFEQDGKLFTFKVSSTSLPYDINEDSSKTCKAQSFSSGVITLTDEANNKWEFQHELLPPVKPAKYERQEPAPCKFTSLFNGKEVANKKLSVF